MKENNKYCINYILISREKKILYRELDALYLILKKGSPVILVTSSRKFIRITHTLRPSV